MLTSVGLFCINTCLFIKYLYLNCTLLWVKRQICTSTHFLEGNWHTQTHRDTISYKMSSNIKVQRICQHCGKEFTARTTVTQYCSGTCSKRAYKARLKVSKIEASNKETQLIKIQPIEQLKAKAFLSIADTITPRNNIFRIIIFHLIHQRHTSPDLLYLNQSPFHSFPLRYLKPA